MDRAAEIAVQARRFRVLSEHDLAEATPSQRIEYAMNAAWPVVDTILVVSADEADLLCAKAVARLREDSWCEPDGSGTADAVLELLSAMPVDRLLAVYYALPQPDSDSHGGEAREALAHHPNLDQHLVEGPPSDEIDPLIELLREYWQFGEGNMVTHPDRLDFGEDDDEAEREFAAFRHDCLRRMLGLPHNLTPEQEAIADAGAAAVDEVFLD